MSVDRLPLSLDQALTQPGRGETRALGPYPGAHSARARRRDASTPARQAAASCEAQPGVFNYGQLTKALMARR